MMLHSALRVSSAARLLPCWLRRLLPATLVAGLVAGALAAGVDPPAGQTYPAQDTLAVGADAQADARQCLQQLAWKPAAFTVMCRPDPTASYDCLVQFPSPIPSGDPVNDRVTLEWYKPPRKADADGQKTPAVVVVHESGRNMAVGRLFARGFQAAGFHSFLIQLPYYGKRNTTGRDPEVRLLFTLIRQGIADVRWARDAVAVLPGVDARQIALQGTSLGGFVVTTSASLDRGYQLVFIMLAGGNLYEMFQHGQREVAEGRRKLAQAGVTDEQLKQLLWVVEPLRIAHRLDPARTWLFSAEQDQVVPFEHALALARAARLDERHHIRIAANHYTGILYFPWILQQVDDAIRNDAGRPSMGQSQTSVREASPSTK